MWFAKLYGASAGTNKALQILFALLFLVTRVIVFPLSQWLMYTETPAAEFAKLGAFWYALSFVTGIQFWWFYYILKKAVGAA